MADLPGSSEGKQNSGRYMWRGALSRCLVSAKLALDPQQHADAAVKCFLAAVEEKRAAQRAFVRDSSRDHSARWLSLLSAYVCIHNRLTAGTYGIADLQLYEKYLDFHKDSEIQLSESNRQYNRAHLLLYHPATPTETSAVNVLRNHKHGYVTIRGNVLSTANFKRFLQRTVDVAEANGNTEVAACVQEQFKERINSTTGRFALLTSSGVASTRPKRHRWPCRRVVVET